VHAKPELDHIVYGVPELSAATDDLQHHLGVRPAAGGKHEGFGTHNALLSLGADCYLELITPDPERPDPERPRPFGLDSLRAPRLVGWAARADELPRRIERARGQGYDAGRVLTMSRATPSGERLVWSLSYRPEPGGDGVVPFLIDWRTTPHPAPSAPSGCRLAGFRAVHPDPQAIRVALRALEVELNVESGVSPGLVTVLEGPAGRCELR